LLFLWQFLGSNLRLHVLLLGFFTLLGLQCALLIFIQLLENDPQAFIELFHQIFLLLFEVIGFAGKLKESLGFMLDQSHVFSGGNSSEVILEERFSFNGKIFDIIQDNLICIEIALYLYLLCIPLLLKFLLKEVIGLDEALTRKEKLHFLYLLVPTDK
jgi:hypothetical protein